MSIEKEITEEVLKLQKCIDYSFPLQIMPAFPSIAESKSYQTFQKEMWRTLVPIFVQLRDDLVEEGIEIEKL